MPLQLDTGKKGLEKFFNKWQIESLRYLWKIHPEGANSRVIHENVNKNLKDSISRTSIIIFLNSMVDEGVVDYTETTGKGGRRRIYSAKYDEAGSKRYMAKKIISKLLETWPETTREAIDRIPRGR